MTPRALSLLKQAIRHPHQRLVFTATDPQTHRAMRYLHRMDLIDYIKPKPTEPGWYWLNEELSECIRNDTKQRHDALRLVSR